MQPVTLWVPAGKQFPVGRLPVLLDGVDSGRKALTLDCKDPVIQEEFANITIRSCATYLEVFDLKAKDKDTIWSIKDGKDNTVIGKVVVRQLTDRRRFRPQPFAFTAKLGSGQTDKEKKKDNAAVTGINVLIIGLWKDMSLTVKFEVVGAGKTIVVSKEVIVKNGVGCVPMMLDVPIGSYDLRVSATNYKVKHTLTITP